VENFEVHCVKYENKHCYTTVLGSGPHTTSVYLTLWPVP